MSVNLFDLLAWILLIVSVVSSFVSGIWWIILTFATSIWWGLGSIFIPFVALIFLIVHWDKAKGPFLLGLFASVIGFACVVAAFTSNGSCATFIKSHLKKKSAKVEFRGEPFNARVENGRAQFGFRDIVNSFKAGRITSSQNTASEEPVFPSLIESVQKRDYEKVKAFLANGADVNAKTSIGNSTALMEASALGYTEIVLALLEHGADLDAKNDEGKTALDVAEENSRVRIIEILKRAQSKTPIQTLQTT